MIYIAGTSPGLHAFSLLFPYALWQDAVFSQSDFSDPTIVGDTATPAGDNIPNLMKYALNLNPKTSGAAGLPVAGTVKDASNNTYLTLTYTNVIAATDIIYTVEVSGDLKTWNSGSDYTAQYSVTNNSDGLTQKVVVQDLTPCNGPSKRFIRLSVTY